MGADAIQKKLDNAHMKLGNKLGYKFGIYRPINNIDVLSDQNLITNVKATFTANDQYTKALAWDVPVWTCYTDAKLIQEGDFLYSEDQQRTFFVLTRQPLLPILVLECPDMVNIQSVGYGDDGTGFAPGKLGYVAKNVPGFMQYSSVTTSGGIPGRNEAVAGIRKVTFITTLPKEQMLMGSVLTDNDGFSGDIIGYDYSSIGRSVKITAQEMATPK